MKYLLPLLACALVACQTIGVPAPKGFDQQLAEAYGTHTAVVSATATALASGAITSSEAQAVQTQAIASRALLDAARAAESSNPAGASNNLALAVTALTALQTYLNAQGKPAPNPAPAPSPPGVK